MAATVSSKRTQCSFLCPFGAFQSIFNKTGAFDIRLDQSKCTPCVLCEKACPTLSITPRAAQSGQPLLSCMKCGACVDARVRDAAVWPIKGTEAGASSERARLMHLYSAWAFAVMFGWFQSAIGAAHVRIDPTYSGGEISHVIERPDYRI